MMQDISKYRFGATKVNDHIFVSVIPVEPEAVDDENPFPVFCIRAKDEELLQDCLEKAKSMDAVLAFLEVKEYEPKMSKLEADIITYWSDLFEKKHKRK